MQKTGLSGVAVFSSDLRRVLHCATAFVMLALTACAQGDIPQTRNVNIPGPRTVDERPAAVNEHPDSVIYLPLGRDVLIPEARQGERLPDKKVGPYELRGETLGGALQLILADIDIPLAFETDLGLTKTITIANLKGNLPDVVDQVCSLANLYCSYEHGALVVKEKETFTVVVPPVGTTEERTTMLTNIATAIKAVTGNEPVVDASNRTIIYEASNRTAEQAARYFQRLRSSTALIVYETYVWEVSLNSGNSAGIQWDKIDSINGFNFGVKLSGTADTDLGTPISIGLPTRADVNLTTGDVLKFISQYGAVKTVSQPQLTVLSGAEAKLRVADRQNYVSEITRTLVDTQTTVSTQTDSVDTGFTLEIASSWDDATVYGTIKILLEEVRAIDTFDENPDAIVQLPQTTEREVNTQVRVRPGDSLLIAGLVREADTFDKSGLGVEKPILPTSRTAATSNVELVFLLKPRVIVFTDNPERYNRAPVKGDAPLPEQMLDRGAQQSRAIPPKAVVEQTSGNAQVFDALSPIPAGPSDQSMAPASLIPQDDVLSTATVQAAPPPASEAVEKAPLPASSVPVAEAKAPAVAPAAPTVAAPALAPETKAADAPDVAKTTDAPATLFSTQPVTKVEETTKAAPSDALLDAPATNTSKAEEAAPLPTPTTAERTTTSASSGLSSIKSAKAYAGPITPSFTEEGPAIEDPDINGQHRPATSTGALGDAVPPPDLPVDRLPTAGGTL